MVHPQLLGYWTGSLETDPPGAYIASLLASWIWLKSARPFRSCPRIAIPTDEVYLVSCIEHVHGPPQVAHHRDSC